MEGVTDAPMRAYQGSVGAFTYAVSEFVRVSVQVMPQKVFRRDIPELLALSRTPTGLPVQVQILGGHPDRVAQSALNAVKAGATAIDINFGCPAKTVNRNDGGATLLQYPHRIYDLVRAVREVLPVNIPVSAKLRLGWDDIEAIFVNAEMAEKGGASWITVHARTRIQGYEPPVFWKQVGRVRKNLGIPVVANGDIWSREDFLKCQEDTGSIHYMIGRGALANPNLAVQIAYELGLPGGAKDTEAEIPWRSIFECFVGYVEHYQDRVSPRTVLRLKQWLKFSDISGHFPYFSLIKRAADLSEFFEILESLPKLTKVG